MSRTDMRQGAGIAPDEDVWVVTFEDHVTICPPDGSACWSPRAGTATVFLDYATGRYREGSMRAPAP